MRLGVYTDYAYAARSGRIYGERAFVLFLAAVARHFESTKVLGRLNLGAAGGRYLVDERQIEFVPLPYYRSLMHPLELLRAMMSTTLRFWKALDDLDCVWLLGPHPFVFPFALLARLRRRKVVLGVRQDTPSYIRTRHPGNRWVANAARVLDGSFRLLARRFGVVAVGPELADHYRFAPRTLEIAVSLVTEDQIESARSRPPVDYEGPSLTALSVGRLETEKNPLLLIDAIARARALDPRWRLVIHGEGPAEAEMRRRAEGLGVAEHVRFDGYLPIDQGLAEVYGSSHALLHVSWTEGLPQVLIESLAFRLPAVATDVGGIGRAIGDAAILIPPGDPDLAASALNRIATDAVLREELVESGSRYASEHTLTVEAERVARFIDGA